LTTDDYGFDADVILPAHAHPTIEAPIYGDPSETVLVGITPAEILDPTSKWSPSRSRPTKSSM